MASKMVFIFFFIFSSMMFSIKVVACHAYYEEMEGKEESRLVERLAMEKNSEELSRAHGRKVISVEDYGAKPGRVDSTVAFSNAWNVACTSSSPISLLIPKANIYLLKPVIFSGPCNSDVSVLIEGTIEASSNPSDWTGNDRRHWILFNSVNNLKVLGGGTINGNGRVWWQKSCKVDKTQPCKDAPTALTFSACNRLMVKNLNLINSQQIHMEFENCMNVTVSTLTITAPGESPNTDRVHIAGTRNITVSNSTIATGDDCISMVSGSQGVMATNITCGPGHGISIGSLGAKDSIAQVSGVVIDFVQFSGTTNGVRIKTWQGGRGYAKNIVFKNIKMKNVDNPIIIDQYYCDSQNPCTQQNSAVQVSNVQYYNIKGTTSEEIAINLNCSRSTPCTRIMLQDIKLVKNGESSAKFVFENVEWTKIGTVIPSPS